MKLLFAFVFVLAAWGCHSPATTESGIGAAPSSLSGASNPSLSGTPADQERLKKTTAAIRDAFSRGDIEAILALHHPDVVKYFGGKNVMTGREMMRKQLNSWLSGNKVEFVENIVESTVFNGETAIETSIFEIRDVPKNGGPATTARGRSMVVYIKYPQSPTGWVSLREMTQEAPAK